MKSLVESPPRTIMGVYKSLPEGTLAELIDNIIYMSPSPISNHQLILNKINNILFNEFERSNRATLYIAPFDVYLDENSNAVQPDIIIVLNQNKNIIDPNGHIHGVPDLLVEILSSGNKDYDLIKKKDLYEKFGVKEYWIVDPETKLALCFEMRNGKFVKAGEEISIINSPLLKMSVRF
jgi:Uma2 family endonuclease